MQTRGVSLSREQGKGAGEGISGKRERRYRVFSVVSEFLNSSANIGLRRGDRDDVSGTRESWGMGGGLGGGGAPSSLHLTEAVLREEEHLRSQSEEGPRSPQTFSFWGDRNPDGFGCIGRSPRLRCADAVRAERSATNVDSSLPAEG